MMTHVARRPTLSTLYTFDTAKSQLQTIIIIIVVNLLAMFTVLDRLLQLLQLLLVPHVTWYWETRLDFKLAHSMPCHPYILRHKRLALALLVCTEAVMCMQRPAGSGRWPVWNFTAKQLFCIALHHRMAEVKLIACMLDKVSRALQRY